MNTGIRNALTAATLIAALATVPAAIAGDQAAATPSAATAVTVYVSMSLGKKMAARDLNAMHEKMAREGWRFADMETNTENGDTEGFWLTYTRP